MFRYIWNRVQGLFSESDSSYLNKDMLKTEYELTFYALHRAENLQQLLESRKRIREFHQRLIESKLETWGRGYVTTLNTLWNGKYKYWKDKARNK